VNDLIGFAAYIFSSMGLTILIVWPQEGPSAWLRDHALRRLLPSYARGALDCYVCLGFWAGLVISIPCWFWYRQPWCWSGCLIVPFLFWWIVVDRTQS
jgi:hypothetical protein